MQNRIERYSRIRRFLGRPFEQSPSPDDILSQMLVDEQTLLNKLTNTGQAWNLIPYTLYSVAGQSEYLISPFDGEIGKIYFCYRETNDPLIPTVPIQFEELNSHLYGVLPPSQNIALANFERIAFYRAFGQNQDIKAVIKPTPVENLTYKIFFHLGQIDRLTANLESTSVLSEHSDYLDLKSAISLLPYALWREENTGNKETDKENIAYNQERRKTIGAGLLFQLQEKQIILDEYIENINGAESFEMPYWNE